MSNIIVDAHAHACGQYLTTQDIEKKLNNAGCDKILLTAGQLGSSKTYKLKNRTLKDAYADVVSANNRLNRIMMTMLRMIKKVPAGNEYVYGLTKELPGKVYQIYWVTRDNVDCLDADYERMGFVGIKLHQCWENFKVGDSYFCRVADWAEKKGLPLFVHMYNREEVSKLAEYIKNHPDLKIVIGHLYCVECFINIPMEMCRNVYFDLSNTYFVSKERFLIGYFHFGAEHFMLGSDTPYGIDALENAIAQIKACGLSEDENTLILGENAKRLYQL